ncbi:amino acid permease [Mycoplasmatota bacterium zrk1]
MTKKGLKAKDLVLLALGTIIGGSFFLGISIPLRNAGPSIIISYLIGGVLVAIILFSLSEMTIAKPTAGSFRTYAQQYLGPYYGFLVGWLYWTGLVLAMSSEALALALLIIRYFPSLNPVFLGTIIILIVTLLNLLGADKLSKIENKLALIKIFAVVGFIVLSAAILFGIFNVTNLRAYKLDFTYNDIFVGGFGAVAGSMLIIMFTYAGFEMIGLAASEAENPNKTVPKAIKNTVLILVSLYCVAVILLLPLVDTSELTPEFSPFVIGLGNAGIFWASNVMNIVLIIAILSTMLAAMFGLGRIMRSLADEGYTPKFLKENTDIPKKGILFSGLAMLIALYLGQILPSSVYIFLVSSSGFSLMFTYLIILYSHYRFRKKHGCPGKGQCQLPGYPYTSLVGLLSIVLIILTMPLIAGQGSGLVAGIVLILVYSIVYYLTKRKRIRNR